MEDEYISRIHQYFTDNGSDANQRPKPENITREEYYFQLTYDALPNATLDDDSTVASKEKVLRDMFENDDFEDIQYLISTRGAMKTIYNSFEILGNVFSETNINFTDDQLVWLANNGLVYYDFLGVLIEEERYDVLKRLSEIDYSLSGFSEDYNFFDEFSQHLNIHRDELIREFKDEGSQTFEVDAENAIDIIIASVCTDSESVNKIKQCLLDEAVKYYDITENGIFNEYGVTIDHYRNQGFVPSKDAIIYNKYHRNKIFDNRFEIAKWASDNIIIAEKLGTTHLCTQLRQLLELVQSYTTCHDVVQWAVENKIISHKELQDGIIILELNEAVIFNRSDKINELLNLGYYPSKNIFKEMYYDYNRTKDYEFHNSRNEYRSSMVLWALNNKFITQEELDMP